MLPTTYTAYIFEDIFLDLQGIKGMLKLIPEIEVIGQGSTLGEALQFCEQHKPGLIIADGEVHGDKTGGPTFVRLLRKKLPDTRFLGLTRYADCMAALRSAGCDFVVNKNLIENEAAAVKYLRETLLFRPEFAPNLTPPTLSPDLDRVLRLICAGLTEDQIAVELKYASRRPVKHFKEQLFDKFGADNVAQLVSLAYKSGYLRPDED
jgi:DNA-binding NarL/FixJ family response regulator